MDQPRGQVAVVRRVLLLHLLGLFVELPQLPLRRVRIHPRQPRCGQRRHPARHNQPQPAIEPSPARVLAAVRQPQHAQRQDAVDGGLRLLRIHSDHRPRLLPMHQRAARVRRPKALLQVHRGAEAVCLPLAPSVATAAAAQHHPLQRLQVAHPCRLARRGSAPVAVGQNLQRPGPRLPEALCCQAQHSVARRAAFDGRAYPANNIPPLAPQLQRASSMLGGKRVLRQAHVEEDLPLLRHHCLRMLRQKTLQRSRNLLDALRGFSGWDSWPCHVQQSLANPSHRDSWQCRTPSRKLKNQGQQQHGRTLRTTPRASPQAAHSAASHSHCTWHCILSQPAHAIFGSNRVRPRCDSAIAEHPSMANGGWGQAGVRCRLGPAEQIQPSAHQQHVFG